MYKANSIFTPNAPERYYIRLCEAQFKTRYYNHMKNFRDRNKPTSS